MLTMLSNQEGISIGVALRKGNTLHIHRFKGGYAHWVRAQLMEIVSLRAFVWFARSCDGTPISLFMPEWIPLLPPRSPRYLGLDLVLNRPAPKTTKLGNNVSQA